jgi:ferric-dicitrate binding protein FerR (iron transport regulator)
VIDHEKNEVKLKPSQSVEYFSGKLEKPKNTDVSLHTDWAHGYYIFNSTPLQEVLTKLSFYQDIDFECDMSVRNLRLSGKLNIRTSFKDILQNLSETAGLEFIPKGNGCIAVTSTNQ